VYLVSMKMKWRPAVVIMVLIFSVLVIVSVTNAFSDANTIPQTRADKDSIGLGVNELQPPECVGMGLTNIVDIGAGETGTSANDLILGTDKADAEIRGGAGNDCILGGKGNERQKIGKDWGPGIFGEEGDDVIIGGPGNQDYCDGGPGNDTYYSCETTY
jgi:Ca2+-binding RTX toxin-like protein